MRPASEGSGRAYGVTRGICIAFATPTPEGTIMLPGLGGMGVTRLSDAPREGTKLNSQYWLSLVKSDAVLWLYIMKGGV